MADDTAEPFLFPAAGRKKVTAAFTGGRLTSDGGVVLLAAAERRLGRDTWESLQRCTLTQDWFRSAGEAKPTTCWFS